MSFILEALRRAEAERERGQVPGLHSPGLPGAAGAGLASAAPRPRPWMGALAGLLAGAVLALAAAWWWRSSGTGPAAPAPMASGSEAAGPISPGLAGGRTGSGLKPAPEGPLPADTGVPPRPQPPVRAGADQAQQGRASAPLADPVAALGSASGPQHPSRAQVAIAPGAAGAVTSGTSKAAPPLPAASAGRSLSGGAAAGGPSPAASAASAVAEQGLSVDQRRRLPPLKIGGSMYSEERSSRMLVVNEQLLREGDRAAAGVVLERIGPSSAQFSFEGRRFELPY